MRALALLLPVLSFSIHVLVVDMSDVGSGDLVEALDLHIVEGVVETLLHPTLGLFNWNVKRWISEGGGILVLLGGIEGRYFPLSDTNEDFLESSAVDLVKVSRELPPESSVFIITDSDVDFDSLRRLGWSGVNVLIFERTSDLVEAISDGDTDGDGFVKLTEIASFSRYAFIPNDLVVSLSTRKIASLAFERVYDLYTKGKLSIGDALSITKAILEGKKIALMFGVGKANVPEVLAVMKGR